MRFLSLLAPAGLAAVAALSSVPAQAATLDFLGFTDNVSGETAIEGQFVANTIFDATYVPIATTLAGYAGSAATGITGASPFAYLDRNSAGVGVCKVVTASAQCNPSSDDNLTTGEILGISFAEDVTVNSLSFRGENHPNEGQFDASDLFDISFDSGSTWTSLALSNAKFGSVAIDVLLKAGDQLLLAFNNEQYYLSAAEVTSAVPVPASLLLLGSALGGFALLRRRAA